jgi:DNA polymerase-3 subunit epsilon
MALAARYLPAAPRSLAGCCATAGIPLSAHHAALADARAAAGLLRRYLTLAERPEPWHELFQTCAAWQWPVLDPANVTCVQRGVSAQRDRHFLARIVDKMPRVFDPPHADAYLALLDGVLLDRHICAREADDLVAVAQRLGLNRAILDRLHRDYLASLAKIAWSDGILTDDERTDLHTVATLLGLDPADADHAVQATHTPPTITPPAPLLFRLLPGTHVVFTGQMTEPRATWEDRARAAGLIPQDNITKHVHLVIAADPDSLSGKARKAHLYGIPIVTPAAFAKMLIQYPPQ